MMKKRFVLAAMLILSCGVPGSGSRAGTEPSSTLSGQLQRNKEWWISQYDRIDSAQNPYVGRAEEVFSRVELQARTQPEREPELVVIGGEGGQPTTLAFAIDDGTIILTLEGLDLCYKDRKKEEGDHLLAFVLGHELAHVASDEFFHRDAFNALSMRLQDPQIRKTLEYSDPRSPEKRRERERNADDQGLVLMTMAGFNPETVKAAGSEFFESWVRTTPGGPGGGSSSHPEPKARAAAVRVRIEETADTLEYFRLGVRYYQMGDYPKAVSLFEVFARQFSGRSVRNNLGLSYFQLAMSVLADCDSQLVRRFKLPVVLDPETLAKPVRRGGPAQSPCYKLKPFTDHKSKARTYLERAVESDPGYRAASLNLISLLIMANEGAGALGAVNRYRQRDGTGPVLEALEIVAFYLYGLSGGYSVDSEEILRNIRVLAAANPSSAIIAFSRARLEYEIEGPERATKSWTRYLALEPQGEFARVAREMIRLKEPSPRKRPNPPLPPPLPPGARGDGNDSWLKTLDPEPLRIEAYPVGGLLYRGRSSRAFTVARRIVLLEEKPRESLTRENVIESHGSPRRSVETTWGEFLDYRTFGFDIRDGRVVTIVFFDDARD